jgi:hypothetical protein
MNSGRYKRDELSQRYNDIEDKADYVSRMVTREGLDVKRDTVNDAQDRCKALFSTVPASRYAVRWGKVVRLMQTSKGGSFTKRMIKDGTFNIARIKKLVKLIDDEFYFGKWKKPFKDHHIKMEYQLVHNGMRNQSLITDADFDDHTLEINSISMNFNLDSFSRAGFKMANQWYFDGKSCDGSLLECFARNVGHEMHHAWMDISCENREDREAVLKHNHPPVWRRSAESALGIIPQSSYRDRIGGREYDAYDVHEWQGDVHYANRQRNALDDWNGEYNDDED